MKKQVVQNAVVILGIPLLIYSMFFLFIQMSCGCIGSSYTSCSSCDCFCTFLGLYIPTHTFYGISLAILISILGIGGCLLYYISKHQKI